MYIARLAASGDHALAQVPSARGTGGDGDRGYLGSYTTTLKFISHSRSSPRFKALFHSWLTYRNGLFGPVSTDLLVL